MIAQKTIEPQAEDHKFHPHGPSSLASYAILLKSVAVSKASIQVNF